MLLGLLQPKAACQRPRAPGLGVGVLLCWYQPWPISGTELAYASALSWLPQKVWVSAFHAVHLALFPGALGRQSAVGTFRPVDLKIQTFGSSKRWNSCKVSFKLFVLSILALMDLTPWNFHFCYKWYIWEFPNCEKRKGKKRGNTHTHTHIHAS